MLCNGNVLSSGSRLHKSVVIYLRCIAIFCCLFCFYLICFFTEQSLHTLSNPEGGERVVMPVKRG